MNGVDDEMQALNMGSPTDYTLSGGLPKDVSPEEGDRAALDAAVIEMRRKEAAGEEYSSYTPPTPTPSIAEVQTPPTEAPVDSKAIHAKLWGKAYHTEAENDAVKQADYVKDVATYVKADSPYVQKMSPILDIVVEAFAGDEGTDPKKLHRAMLEIGAHESEGGTQLYNKVSGASGVFQVLASTVLATSSSTYYGPKAQALAGRTPEQIQAMTKEQRENWMQTDTQANAVFGTIELIKLSKGLANNKKHSYLKSISTPKDKTNWEGAIK